MFTLCGPVLSVWLSTINPEIEYDFAQIFRQNHYANPFAYH